MQAPNSVDGTAHIEVRSEESCTLLTARNCTSTLWLSTSPLHPHSPCLQRPSGFIHYLVEEVGFSSYEQIDVRYADADKTGFKRRPLWAFKK